jgi:hypothetical protein
MLLQISQSYARGPNRQPFASFSVAKRKIQDTIGTELMIQNDVDRKEITQDTR